jgi:uncharacterized damage-inducible protein DinB
MRNKGDIFVLLLAIVAIVAGATLVLAQNPADPLVSGQKALDTRVKDYLIRSAEKMPEENYSFKPTPDVRSFGQLLGHVADSQYAFGSALLGEKNPEPGIEKAKTTKADLIQALKDAFAYSDKAYTGLTDAQAAQMVTFYGRQAAKLTILSMNNAHNSEHYGNIVTYLRIKGLVPPSSEPRR